MIIMIFWIKHMLVWQPYYIFDSWLGFSFIAKYELWKNKEKGGILADVWNLLHPTWNMHAPKLECPRLWQITIYTWHSEDV